jgi:hypothetical protein
VLVNDDIADAGRAMNCILSAYHLHEWIWARSFKDTRPLILDGVTIHEKKDFVNWLSMNCPHFDLLQEFANGTKHCAPVHSTGQIKGFGRGPFGIGPFGKAYLLIDLGHDNPSNRRYLVASTVLNQVVEYWENFFLNHLPAAA